MFQFGTSSLKPEKSQYMNYRLEVTNCALVTICVYKTLSVKNKNHCKKFGVSCDTSDFFSVPNSSCSFL